MPTSLSERACLALALRAEPTTQIGLYNKYLSDYKGEDLRILRFCQNTVIRVLAMGNARWDDSLSVIARCFMKGVVSERLGYDQMLKRSESGLIPIDYAIRIVSNTDEYPSFLVAAAESMCRESVARKISPVGQVPEAEDWFSE